MAQDFESKMRAARQRATGGAPVRSTGVLAALPGLTDEDLAGAEARAGESVGFLSGLTPDSPGAAVPGIRQGVRFQQERGYAEALGRIERGEGTRDDSMAVLDRLVDRSRRRTFMGGVGEMVQDFALTGAEILIPGMAVGRAAGAAAAAGARMGSATGAAALRALGSRAARTLGTLAVGAPMMREGLPRLVGLGGGAMSASALQRAMPGAGLTTDDAGRLAVWMEESFADFLEADVPAWKGVVDEAIEMAAEATGGPLMKLPLLRQLQGAQVKAVERLLGGFDNDVARFLKEAADAGVYNAPIGELLENRVSTAGKAAVPGMEETFADVIPGAREAAQELLAAAAVGGAPVAVGAATVAGQQRRRETAQAGVREALGEDEQAPVPSPLDVEGGDPASAGPGATPEALGPATFRALAPEEREADVAAYRAALRATAAEDAAEPEVRVVEPRTRGELAVQALLRRRGIDPTFVEGGAADAPGFFPGPGRAVIARGTDAYGAGVHEALHTWWAQESAEGRRALELELESVDPGFLARVSEWRAENARIETPEMAREEALTTGGQVLASMARYLRTAQGAADFAVVHEESPGALRRAGEALVDALGTLVPRLPITRRAAARDRLAVLDSALASPGATARLAQATVRALDSIAPVFDAPPVAGEAEESAQEVARARATPEEQREARRLEREAIRTKQRQARASREAERAARPAEEAAALGLGSDEGSFEISAEIEAAVVAARDLRRVREAAARTEAQREAQAERVAVRAEGPKPSKPRGRVKPRVVEDTDEVAELRETSRDTASRAASFDPREFDEPAAEAAPVAEIEDDPFAGLGLPAGPGPLADQSLVERLALRTPAQRRARPITLVDHVLALGGFDMRGTDGRNEAAEIEEQIFGMGGRRRGGLPAGLLRGVGSKATARGLTPDDMREALRERGFVGRDGDGRMSFDAMIEAIGAEVGGDMPTLPAGDATLVEREVARQGRGASSGVDGLWDVAFGGAFAPSLAGLLPAIPALDRARVSAAVDWLRLRLQDDTVPIRELPEFRTAVKRSRAIAPARIERFERAVDDLLRPLGTSAATLADVQRAMVLTAGLERNAWMASERGVQSGSGITDTAAAERELADIRARVGGSLVDDFLAGIARLNKERLDHLVETRMVDAADADRWHEREPHWVSMRDLDLAADEHVGFETSGRSVQVRNPQIRRAEGRETEAENVLVAWFSETVARMRAAEKNRAMHVGADLARRGVPGIRVIAKPQGVPGGFTAPADHVAFVDGREQMYLVMASEDAAAALKGLNGEQTGFVLNAIGRLTRMFSRSVTGRNPFFWVPNFLRDTTQALWTVAAERDIRQGARVLGRAWAVLPGMIRYQLTGDSRAVPEIEAAKRAGFKTTWIGRQTLQELLDEFRVKVEGPSSIRDKVRASLSWLERMGDAFEMATRYAAFTHELEKQTARGVARPEAELRAADFARELTLNFDTRGTWTPALSSLYAFFNPAVQGSARLIRTALSGPRGYAAVGAVVVMGALMEALGYALADEDPETGLNEYGSIPEWEKSRNIVLPFKIGGAFPKITLPYGLDAIFGMGRRGLHFAADGGIDPRQTRWKALQEGVMHAGASFNPIGDIADPFAMAAPTVVRPFVEIERNQKFGGRPIMKDATNFGATIPDSARAFSTIDDRLSGWLALRIADVLNLGGPEELPTGLDVSPESIQHLIEFATAGFGLRELDRVSEFALSKREVRVASTAPVLRNFAAAVTDHHVSELYYGVRNTASTLHGLAKNAESPAEVAAIRERDPKAWALKERLGRIDRRLSQLGRVLRAGSLIPSEARAVREQMTAWQARIVRAYYGDTAAAQ